MSKQARNPEQAVVIAADKDVRYEAVLEVMDMLQQNQRAESRIAGAPAKLMAAAAITSREQALAGALAFAMHVLFLVLLVFGVTWQQKQIDTAVVVDLWRDLPPSPQPRAEAPPPPPPAVKPEPPPPAPKVEAKPPPKPEPAPSNPTLR